MAALEMEQIIHKNKWIENHDQLSGISSRTDAPEDMGDIGDTEDIGDIGDIGDMKEEKETK
jgi:hypothetical protein